MTCARLAVALAVSAAMLAGAHAAAAALHVPVPLDRTGAVPGTVTLTIHRDSKPRASRPVTLLLPGAAGASANDPYEWEELMPRQQIVTFDPRGTGRRALRCRDLEAADPSDAGAEAAACATLLGDSRGFFRASDTVEDIEAIRAWIGVPQITIVGPGYGSYVAQRYALRYPEHVRRLILTSVVDAAGLDPLFGDAPAATRRALADMCRGKLCDGFTRDPAADTARLVAKLASAPLRGPLVGRFGRTRQSELSREDLFFLLVTGDGNFFTRPDYPAAVTSALRDDPAPILRLARRARNPLRGVAPHDYSVAAEAAATCEEVRFPWTWHATPAERAEAARQAEAGMDPALASPFDPGTLAGSAPMRLCARWPTASAGPPPGPGPMPDVPALVLADASHIATPLEAAARTAARFPRGQLLATTLVPLDRCAELAVTRFMRGQRVQDRCPAAGPLVPPARPAPTSLRDLSPLRGVPGRRGRLLKAFALTFGELIDGLYADLFTDPAAFASGRKFRAGGLRGGSIVVGEELLRMDRYEFVPRVRLSGRFSGDGGPIPLRIDGPGRLDGRIRVAEPGDDDLVFRVRGRIAGRRVHARVVIHSRLLDAIEQSIGGSASAAALPLLP
ncbi:MAG TPA: alpha/beta fold hydrolase [Thermoleophilaceae bacterium]